MNTQGKILNIILGFIGLVVVVGLAGIWYVNKTYLNPPIVAGQVRVETGEILVNGDTVTSTMEVKQGDSIETMGSSATVLLHQSVIVRLKPNTRIVLEDMKIDHPVLKQEKGSTWNHFTKLSGVKAYTMMEGNNRATAVGTIFELSRGKLMTAEGTVAYQANGKTFDVTPGRVVETMGGEARERALTPTERTTLRTQLEQSVRELQSLRREEINKYPTILNQIKQQFKITDEQIEQGLMTADEGQINVDDMVAKVPVRIGAIDRIADLTKAIQALKQYIRQF